MHNVFTEEINKITLSSNDDKRIDLIKTYAYGTIKDLLSEKEEIKCSNIIKRYKERLTLMMLQKKKKHKRTFIQIGHKFLIIHTEY